MKKLFAAFAALLVIPAAFADSLLPSQPFTPMDIVWHVFAFCVFIILFILHHMMIEQKLARTTTR